MNLCEYNSVENLTYLEYCDYLQSKYGIGICDYMTPNWSRKNRVSRTNEGLIAHHIFENQAPNLSVPEYAKKYPFEWQKQKNIVYCNYLEHFFLHILICEDTEKSNSKELGIRGIASYILPDISDFYDGIESEIPWKKRCFQEIKYNYDTYTTLLKRFMKRKNSF